MSTPYLDGKKTGRVDRLLNHRSEYAWAGCGDLNEYASAFARGYRDGWLAEDRLSSTSIAPTTNQEG